MNAVDAVEVNQFGHQSGSARLMIGPQTGSIVAVVVLVEQKAIALGRLGPKFVLGTKQGAMAIRVVGKDADQATAKLDGHFGQGD